MDAEAAKKKKQKTDAEEIKARVFRLPLEKRPPRTTTETMPRMSHKRLTYLKLQYRGYVGPGSACRKTRVPTLAGVASHSRVSKIRVTVNHSRVPPI